ncbi:hypothetical protein [Streptomyces sp. NPDC005969]
MAPISRKTLANSLLRMVSQASVWAVFAADVARLSSLHRAVRWAR